MHLILLRIFNAITKIQINKATTSQMDFSKKAFYLLMHLILLRIFSAIC